MNFSFLICESAIVVFCFLVYNYRVVMRIKSEININKNVRFNDVDSFSWQLLKCFVDVSME